jgi:hypothetical protein
MRLERDREPAAPGCELNTHSLYDDSTKVKIRSLQNRVGAVK